MSAAYKFTEITEVKISIIIEIELANTTKKKVNKIKSTTFKIRNDITIEDLIKKSIEKFNEEFAKKNLTRRFENNYSNYKIIPALTGYDKYPDKFIEIYYDISGYDKKRKVSTLSYPEFALLFKNEDLIEIKENHDCCIIM